MNRRMPLRNMWAAFAVVMLLSQTVEPAQAAKGGGGKVTVTAAEPAEAEQGQELDVYISGDGFDDGSTATFYVSGTRDDSQIIVDSTVYEESTGRLKSRIRVNGSAAVTDYDIEVQNSGGRRGKGTTLFKVQQSNGNGQSEPCSSEVSLEPTITYLTGFKMVDGVNSADIMLSNETGCLLTLLVEGAHQYLSPTGQDDEQDRFIQSVWKLSYAARGNRGFVAWVNHYHTPDIVLGIGFDFNAQGEIFPDSVTAQELYVPPLGRTVDALDIHLKLNPVSGEYEPQLAMVEYSESDPYDRLLSVFNATSRIYEVISQGPCNVPYSGGGCWLPSWWEVRWSPGGDEIYFQAYNMNTESPLDGIGRIQLLGGAWQEPALVVVPGPAEKDILLGSVSSSGLMVYGLQTEIYRKNGRLMGTAPADRLLDLNAEECGLAGPCLSTEGVEIPRGSYGANRRLRWTFDHRLVFLAVGSTNYNVEEILDPLTGEMGPLSIRNVENQADTSE